MSSARTLAAGLLTWVVVGTTACEGDGFGFPPPTGFSEATTSREMSVHLDEVAPNQRYVFPIIIEPASTVTEALFRATIVRLNGDAVGEVDLNDFATDTPAGWLGLFEGGALETTFLASSSDVRLSLGASGGIADIALILSVTAPDDLDFDGTSDGITLEIGNPTPLIQ